MSRPCIGGWLAAALILSVATLPAAAIAAARSGPAEGRIVDVASGEPLSDVTISAGDRFVTTARDGRFRLLLPANTTTVTLRRIGYGSLVIDAADLHGEIRMTRAPVVLHSMEVTAEPDASRGLGEGSQLAYGIRSREDISIRATPSLAEALDGAEGVSSSRPGNWGAKAYVRGLGGERVVVMLDGNRVERACNVGMDGGLATIQPDNVERVELLSGPGSTLYGSGNVGGVINVVTRATRDDLPLQGELRASASSAVPGGRLGATLWGHRQRASFTASVDGASFGDQRSPLGTIDASSYRDLTVDLAGSYALSPSHRLDLRTQHYAGRDIGYPGSGNAFIPEEDRSLYALDYGWQRSGRVLDGLTAKVFVQSVDHHMTMSMVKPPSMPGGMTMRSDTDARSQTDIGGGRIQGRFHALPAFTFDAGIEATRWNAEGSRWVERTKSGATTTMELRTWPGVRVTDIGAFVQGGTSSRSWLIGSAGLRLDRVTRSADGYARTSESVASGNVGLRARHASGLYMRSSLGIGYRIPDPTELFGILLRPDGYVYVGNADLTTETSRNAEVTIGYAGRTMQASATAFRNRIEEYIATSVTGDSLSGMPVRRYDNIGAARLTGASGTVAADAASWLRLRGTVSYTEGENLSTGGPLPLVAPLEGSASARLTPWGSWPWVEAEMEAAAEQTRAAVAQGETNTPGFVVWNLRTGTSRGRTSVTLGIENVFDDAYRRHLDPSRLWRPGRNVYARIAQRF